MKQENKNPQLKTGDKGLFVLKLIKFMQPGETAYIHPQSFHIQQVSEDTYNITLILTHNCCVTKIDDSYNIPLLRDMTGNFIIDPKGESVTGQAVFATPFVQPKDGPEHETITLGKMAFRYWDMDAAIATFHPRKLHYIMSQMSEDYYNRHLDEDEEKNFLKIEKAFDERIHEFAASLSLEELETEINDYVSSIKRIRAENPEDNKRALEKYEKRLKILQDALDARPEENVSEDDISDAELTAMTIHQLDEKLQSAVDNEDYKLAARIRALKDKQ